MAQITKILVPLDLSEHTQSVTEYAQLLAKNLGAKILVLYVVPAMGQYMKLSVSASEVMDFVSQINEGAKQSMAKCLKENFEPGMAEGKVITGYAPDKILAVAEEDNADLIVMGCHGRKGIDHMLFGSVAEKVVKSAKVPVLTVRVSL